MALGAFSRKRFIYICIHVRLRKCRCDWCAHASRVYCGVLFVLKRFNADVLYAASNAFVIMCFPCQYAHGVLVYLFPHTPHPPIHTVLPPVLVPRNPEVIAAGARYEPIPSYLDTQRSIYSPDNECPSLNFDTPGTQWSSLQDASMHLHLICVVTLALHGREVL